MTTHDALIARARARVGTVLRAKWRLDSVIGVGGMASVFAATHRNGSRGAVKMLHLELSLDDGSRERFLREGYVANMVGHPGAVAVLDDDIAEDGSVFLVMELLEGATLADLAEKRPGLRLEAHEVVDAARKLLDVLAAAHDKGIVHRDLKPENVFRTSAGTIKVLDFGIARLKEHRSGGATQTGAAMGTPAYMPPEQALGEWTRVGPRSDLWAVGATMFTLLSGRTVHEADGVNKLLLAAMTKPAPPLASILPGAPPALAAVVDRALAFEPDARYASAREMLAALDAVGHVSMATMTSAATTSGTAPTVAHNPAIVMTAAPTSSDPEPLATRGATPWGAIAAGVAIAFTLSGGAMLYATHRLGGAPAAPAPPLASIETTQAPPPADIGSATEAITAEPAPPQLSAIAPGSSAGAKPAKPAPPVVRPVPPHASATPTVAPAPTTSASPSFKEW